MVCQRVEPRPAPLALRPRDGLAHVVGDGGDVGHDHDRQDEPGREDAAAADVLAAEQAKTLLTSGASTNTPQKP